MPHLILEYSNNISIAKNNLNELLQRCNHLLAEMLPTELTGCKSRAYVCDNYCIGAGRSDDAFVHANLSVMPGRTPEKLQTLGQNLLTLLSNHFAAANLKLHLQITLEISESGKNYFKLAV